LTSEASRRAVAFVDGHLPRATALGAALADLIDEPTAFASTLTEGLTRLADPVYAAEQERIAPGSGATIGVRWPLIHVVDRQLRRPLRDTSSAIVFLLAQRLASAPEREVRLMALPCLRRTLPDEPERSWQLLRRLARGARDWISVDSLADVFAQGVLAERFRWAELEQLAYSDHVMERRLVGSTIARLAHAVPRARRSDLAHLPALTIIKSLIGDADDEVQKSLSWALREWGSVDPAAVTGLLRAEAKIAVDTQDGHRAWVVRDALSAQPAAVASTLRAQLRGIRRRPGSGSTSRAAFVAARFGLGALADTVVAGQGDRYARRSA
jgi:3-methyladenine DNA glycosylase AlkD